MSVTWSNELEMKFLEYFEAEPVLWTINLKDCKNKLKNHDAWNRLSALMELPIADLKSKKMSLYAVTLVSIVTERENCNENYLKNFVSVYPKEVLATVLVENLRRCSRECLARV